MASKNIFGRIVEAVVTTASTELSEKLGDATGMSERSKAQLRRRARRELNGAVKNVTARFKKAIKKRPEKIDVSSLKLITACGVLRIPVPREGTPIDLELARKNKLAAARLFHPDAMGGNESKRAQFEVVVEAYAWLEKYNDGLEKK